jgi:hypothetical protein
MYEKYFLSIYSVHIFIRLSPSETETALSVLMVYSRVFV